MDMPLCLGSHAVTDLKCLKTQSVEKKGHIYSGWVWIFRFWHTVSTYRSTVYPSGAGSQQHRGHYSQKIYQV